MPTKDDSTKFFNMAAIGGTVAQEHCGGFSFENCKRNALLEKMGAKLPTARKTGTTIAGIVFKDGVVLGADTRATEDTIVADKNCSKIHYIAPNIYCCGAGTAADTEYVTNLISSHIQLHSLSTGRQARIVTALRMLKQLLFRYQGYISAALVLGGVDLNGPTLHTVYPHGSTDKLPYVTMVVGYETVTANLTLCALLAVYHVISSSGSLAAMSVFESRYKPDLELEDAKKLVRDAIAAGIFNDLGSGSNVDLCVITKEGTQYLRPYDVANEKGVRQGRYSYKRGATAVLTKDVKPIVMEVTETRVTQPGEAMEM